MTWQRPKVGYYFGTSDRYRTGYHLDDYSDLKAMSNNNNIDVNGDDREKKRSVRFSDDTTLNSSSSSSSKQQSHSPSTAIYVTHKRQKTGEELLLEAEQDVSASSSCVLSLDVSGMMSGSSIQISRSSSWRQSSRLTMRLRRSRP